MKRELRDRWCAALRSGKYKQGKGHLHQGRKFCCLGVLADIEGAEWELYDDKVTPRIYYSPTVGVQNLYFAASKRFGLRDSTEPEAPIRFVTILILMNDGATKGDAEVFNLIPDKSYTFEEIADWIEQNIPAE